MGELFGAIAGLFYLGVGAFVTVIVIVACVALPLALLGGLFGKK